MRRLVWLNCVALAVSMGACKGESKHPAIAAATTVKTTTSTTIDPAVMYRQQYLNIVAAGNCRQKEIDDVFSAVTGPDERYNESDWARLKATVQPAYIAYADAQILSFQTAAQLQWPPAAQSAVQDLIKLFAADAARARAVGEAKAFNDFVSANDAYAADTSTSNAAATVRALLGLPTNLVDDGYDWCKGPPDAATLTQSIPTTTSTPPTSAP